MLEFHIEGLETCLRESFHVNCWLFHDRARSEEGKPRALFIAEQHGGPAITSRDLVANALRMRPDRIIVGECRRSEAFDMLQAMNTGHEGSMTTIHANTARDGLARLETLCMMANIDVRNWSFCSLKNIEEAKNNFHLEHQHQQVGLLNHRSWWPLHNIFQNTSSEIAGCCHKLVHN